jgi:SAM-dependent methyltransferase
LLAPLRQRQIDSLIDRNYIDVIKPTALKLIRDSNPLSVLDIGCGIGDIAKALSVEHGQVVAIDPSETSIQIAKSRSPSNVEFIVSSIEDYRSHQVFDAVLANMVLMDVIDLNSFLAVARKVVSNNGVFVFSITHPCFWPEYYGYSDAEWFSYSRELIIEAPFRISDDLGSQLISTHVHRPLETYVRQLNNHGFRVQSFLEPLPSNLVKSKKMHNTPHVLFATCKII